MTPNFGPGSTRVELPPLLPELIINRHFMTAFIEAEPPCVALGRVEIEASPSALIALRFNQPIPKSVMAGDFAFGHSLLQVTQPRAPCSPPWSRLVATSSSR